MFDVIVTMDGRAVDATEPGDLLRAAAADLARQHISSRLGSLLCPQHREPPTVWCDLRSAGGASLEIGACCDELRRLTMSRLEGLPTAFLTAVARGGAPASADAPDDSFAAFSVALEAGGRVAVIRRHGPPGIAVTRAALAALKALPASDTDRLRGLLVDLRDVPVVPTPIQALAHAEEYRAAAAPRRYRLAYLTREGLQHSVAQLVGTAISASGVPARVFRDAPEAMAWVAEDDALAPRS